MSCVWKLILPGKILKKLQDYPVLPRSAGVKKDYILASFRFAVMFFRCILGRSWESLCGIINVGKKTELSGNWDRSFYRFSTFFSLPVFDSARFICSQLEPVRPPLTFFFLFKKLLFKFCHFSLKLAVYFKRFSGLTVVRDRVGKESHNGLRTHAAQSSHPNFPGVRSPCLTAFTTTW